MVLKKLSRSVAAVATAAMMVSPMMAMAANSPETAPTAKDLVADGKAEATFDEKGNVTSLTVVGNTDDGVLAISQNGGTAYLVIKGGKWDKDFDSVKNDVVTPVELGGEQFIAEDGVVLTTVNGIVTDAKGAYFVAAGRIVKEADQVASYEDPKEGTQWFVVKNGRVDVSFTGTKEFADKSGTGLFAAGRLIKEFSGVTDDGKDSYYVQNGVVRTDLNGDVVLPDGNHYQFKNGVLQK